MLRVTEEEYCQGDAEELGAQDPLSLHSAHTNSGRNGAEGGRSYDGQQQSREVLPPAVIMRKRE